MLLLNVAGEDVIDLASTFDLSDEDLDNYDNFNEAFDNCAAFKRNETYKRQEGNKKTVDMATKLTVCYESALWWEYGTASYRKPNSRVKDFKLDQAIHDCRVKCTTKILKKNSRR
ncbi:hypothetical protein PR048_004226 [Dryococelus australis]|uniref:Uncharacterized protein n=1 Tax=Dryococelus australis TaxID=614101 RepID=A0ABQ9I5C3_9NEOP|nr:hypothetical protein PR048_004226 [Dryococelus australis]